MVRERKLKQSGHEKGWRIFREEGDGYGGVRMEREGADQNRGR